MWKVIVNTPGYLPWDDEEHAYADWQDAADELRQRLADHVEYLFDTEQVEACERVSRMAQVLTLTPDKEATIYADASDSEHDLGVAFSIVQVADYVSQAARDAQASG